MNDFDNLTHVKNALGITGNYQDGTLKVWIYDLKEYLKSAGVKDEVVNSQRSSGAIARGVADIWNYGSGDGKLSSYFYERATQLSLTGVDKSE